MATQEKKEHITGRVSKEAIENIIKVGGIMKWSFNQTLDEAMKRIRVEDVILEMTNKIETKNISPDRTSAVSIVKLP